MTPIGDAADDLDVHPSLLWDVIGSMFMATMFWTMMEMLFEVFAHFAPISLFGVSWTKDEIEY